MGFNMRLLQYLAAGKIDAGSIPTLDADIVLASALNIVYMLAGAVAVFVIIFAGFTYVTANGDAAKISRAKNEIMYASAADSVEQTKKAISIIVNVVVGLLAYALMYAFLNFIIPGGLFT